MISRQASAPGKVLLAGEYAVLYGAPAIVAAADRRAVVRVQPMADGASLRTLGHRDGRWPFQLNADFSLTYHDPAPAFPLFEAVVAQCRPRWLQESEVYLDTRAFSEPDSGSKLGLGSSAALTVALVAALSGNRSPTAILDIARQCHRRFQRGAGSGADIAAAVFGGTLVYRMGQKPVALDWPRGLRAIPYWSGQSASTTGKIRRLRDSLNDASTDAALQALSLESAKLLSAWGGAAAMMPALGEYTAALREFDVAHDLGIFAAGHAALRDRAMQLGLVYKPCGAGGGDVGVLFAMDGDDLAGFDTFAVSRGFGMLDVALGGDGFAARNT